MLGAKVATACLPLGHERGGCGGVCAGCLLLTVARPNALPRARRGGLADDDEEQVVMTMQQFEE